MYAFERQQAIGKRVRELGRVSVTGLARTFDASVETIRRDLAQLEAEKVLRRVHGGAVDLARLLRPEPPMAERAYLRVEEKRRMAAAALRLLPDEGVVFLEAASTSMVLAESLPIGSRLTVVTNGIPIANLLGARADIEVLMIGGRIRRATLATMDDWALDALEALHVDVAVLGTIGFSLEGGLTAPDLAEAAVKRRTLKIGEKVVLLAEAAKYGAISLCRYGDIGDLDLLVTDASMDTETAKRIRSAGPEVTIAA